MPAIGIQSGESSWLVLLSNAHSSSQPLSPKIVASASLHSPTISLLGHPKLVSATERVVSAPATLLLARLHIVRCTRAIGRAKAT